MTPPSADNGLRVTLLGSGSPSPSLIRSQPAALVQWGEGASVLVDAGDGVVAQLLRAGVALRDVRHLLLTHLHWDHVLGYPAFVWGSWTAGRTALSVWGPAGTADMHRRLVADFYGGQARWAIELGFDPAGWEETAVSDIAAGWTMELAGCTITAGAVVHPPMAALGFRFEYGGRSLVLSGDTAACPELVELAQGADLLVVDACAAPPPPTASPARRALIERLRHYHASPQDCVEMAGRAGVGTVVLNHHLPDAEPSVDATGFAGTVLIGTDHATYHA